MTIREFYTLVGGSYDDMSERFPSDALILRFLTMLPQDGSMELLARSVDAADAKTAFRAVHTLKGCAAAIRCPPPRPRSSRPCSANMTK